MYVYFQTPISVPSSLSIFLSLLLHIFSPLSSPSSSPPLLYLPTFFFCLICLLFSQKFIARKAKGRKKEGKAFWGRDICTYRREGKGKRNGEEGREMIKWGGEEGEERGRETIIWGGRSHKTVAEYKV